MERDAFLAALHSSCKGLGRFFTQKHRRWITGIIAGGEDIEERELTIDRIYELLCYFSLLSFISGKVDLECRESVGPKGYRLPYSPGHKRNFAFFRFGHNKQIYDICCGTGIPSEENHFEHPDISLQRMDSEEDPGEPGEPVAIWDAKYHTKGMSKNDLAQINLWCDLLGLQPYSEHDILEQIMPKQFRVTAVITNSERADNIIYKQQALKKGFSFVFDYKGLGTGTNPEPSREEHLEAQHKRKR